MNRHNEDMLNATSPAAPARPRRLVRAVPSATPAQADETVTEVAKLALPADATETQDLLAPEPEVSEHEDTLATAVAGMHLEAPLPDLSAAHLDRIAEETRRLMDETRQNERSRRVLEEAMERLRAADPEGRSMQQGELDRAREQIALLQREVAAMRRATQVYGNSGTRAYWIKMGRGLEESAEEVLDALDRGDPAEVLAAARRIAQDMLRFGGECTAYGEVLP